MRVLKGYGVERRYDPISMQESEVDDPNDFLPIRMKREG